MRPIRTFAPGVAAALSFTAAASADQPLVFGPFEYDAAFTFTNCGFPVDVALHGTFTNRVFISPERSINYIRRRHGHQSCDRDHGAHQHMYRDRQAAHEPG